MKQIDKIRFMMISDYPISSHHC